MADVTVSPQPGLKPGTHVLVTGGGGFLGKAIVKKLLERGLKVRSFARGAYPDLEKMGVQVFRGSITDASDLEHAAKGCEIVFHVAAKPGVWGSYQEFFQPNFVGTQTVVATCRKLGIPRLVYTSSPSVVFDGKSMENGDESAPYPEHYETHYPRTKAMAEKLVLSSNAKEMATVSLRPHLIWGPGDNHLAPRIVSRARAGRVRIIGDNTNKVDCVYVENAADAHLQAAERLAFGAPPAGKAYFIANGEPTPLWDWVNMILAAAKVPPITASVSARTAWWVGLVLEIAYKMLPLHGEPPMTRFVASEMSTAHWFNLGAAKRDFGYVPRVSTAEGMQHLAEWFGAHPEVLEER